MQPTSPCNRIQERIVAGDALDEASQAHTLACASCGRVAAEWLALDSAIALGMEGGLQPPEGFADRVMATIGAEPDAAVRSKRWLQVALANIGLAVAIANLLRFVFSTLLPATSLGGAL